MKTGGRIKGYKKGGKSNHLAYDGIYICDSGGSIITQQKYNEIFKGWGFTFL